MLTTVAGLAAVFAGSVYVLGGAVLSLRLTFRRVPADVVVAGIPREFLISIGLAVTLQLLMYIGIFAFVFRSAPKRLWTRRLILVALLAAAVLAYPLARSAEGSTELTLIAITWASTALLLFLLVRRVVVRSSGRTRLALGASLLLTVTPMFVAWRIAHEYQASKVLDAAVCGTDHEQLAEGLFIGENDTRVYIGEKTSGQPARIAEIPRDRILVLVIGRNPTEGLEC